MEWINIHRPTLETEAMLDAEPADVHTWLQLLSYCIGQENGGCIKGAEAWPEHKWPRVVRITAEAVRKRSGLWRWKDGDLWVEFYPAEREKEVVAKRRAGAKGARSRWHPKMAHQTVVPMAEPMAVPLAHQTVVPMAEPSNSHMGKGKGKSKGKGIGRKEEEEEETGSSSSELCFPSEEQVRAWAIAHQVDVEYALEKWREANEGHWWVVNGQLIDWESRWLRFWTQDRAGYQLRKKTAAAEKSVREFRQPSDPPEYWTEEVERLNGQLFGMSQNPERCAEFFRLREVLNFRSKHNL